jgi:hypothetical protein
MATQHNEERDVVQHERAPLLGSDDVRNDEGTNNEPTIEEQKPTSRTWKYVWKGCLFILAVLMIAVFVKGWIDADNVDVRSL